MKDLRNKSDSGRNTIQPPNSNWNAHGSHMLRCANGFNIWLSCCDLKEAHGRYWASSFDTTVLANSENSHISADFCSSGRLSDSDSRYSG